MSDQHVMLDLETFGTGPDAAIVQVGAVRFDLTSPDMLLRTSDVGSGYVERAIDGFERTIALQSSILAGGSVDPETIAWWRRQSPGAQRTIERGEYRLADALRAFAEWLPEDAYLWAHGAAFDVPVLASAYRALGMTELWDHRRVRDTRTLFALAAELAGWERPRRETAHTALADAVTQAEDVRAAWAALRRETMALERA